MKAYDKNSIFQQSEHELRFFLKNIVSNTYNPRQLKVRIKKHVLVT